MRVGAYGTKLKCPYPNCDVTNWYEDKMAEHARIPHVRCSCGRDMPERGWQRHRTAIEKNGRDHPDFSLIPSRPDIVGSDV